MLLIVCEIPLFNFIRIFLFESFLSNDFLTVISQTKKNILNYEGLNKLINSKKIKGAEKSKINLNKIKKLDKIILNFDKDLIYNYERIKKEE